MNASTFDDPAPATPAARAGIRKAAIGLITLTMLTGTAARYALSPLQELVRKDLGLGDNQMALLQGMAIALPTALMSIPLGRLVDRANRARLLVILALICAAGSVVTAFAQDFATTFIARMLVCAAVVAAQPAALSLVADLTSAAQRGRMIMLTSLGQAFGGALAFVLAGMLLSWLPTLLRAGSSLSALAPWRLVQLAFAAAVLVAAGALLLMREPPRQEVGAAQGAKLRAALRELWAYRRFLLPLVGGMVTVGMADAAAAIWTVPVLTRNFHQTPADFGTWMGMLNLGSNVLGAVLGGLAADLGQRGRGRSGVMLGAVLGAGLSVPAALFPVMPDVTGFAILMALLLTAGACVNIAATSAMMVILPNELRGICFSLLIAVIGLAAFGIAPLLVSLAAQAFGQEADIAVPLTYVGVITSLCALGAFIRAMRVAKHS
ncbi:MFS transporter [Roseateles violae]|uniref:MFS transporter n=1 Tax=Roseateles violae TaxID=3058042 RepID=A0ABT8DVL9_9BURK|nr:MFS transporter [Pelomonas sp. PFR6]MDN3922131.1 MFS transporter [Pelomonas sp. PFR6]